MSESVSTDGTGPAETGASTTDTTDATKTPEWYEAELTKVRNEAAANRVKGNEKAAQARAEAAAELQSKLDAEAEARTKAEITAASHERNFTKYETALEAVLGEETAKKVVSFARAIQGKDADEMKAHAAELKSLFGLGQKETTKDDAIDPSQGHGGGTATGEDFGAWITNVLDKQR